MPNTTYAQFADVRDDYFTMGLHHRRLYASMVNYMDTAIGDIVQVVKDKHTTGAAASMWAHTLVVFQTGKRHTSGFVLCHTSCPKEHALCVVVLLLPACSSPWLDSHRAIGTWVWLQIMVVLRLRVVYPQPTTIHTKE